MYDIAQDSFKSCTTFLAALHVLQILAPDLIARLDEDFEVTQQLQLALHAACQGTCHTVACRTNWIPLVST